MSAAADLNDQAKAGALDLSNPIEGATPLNDAARKVTEETPRVLTTRQVIGKAYQRAVSREERKFCSSLHYKIDLATGGLRPGAVWVFGADTNWGKSTWAVGVIDEAIADGYRALIISAEDDERIYGDRLLARRARIHLGGPHFSASRLRAGRLNQTELDAVTDVYSKAEDRPLFLDARGKDVETVCRQASDLIRGEGIGLVMWDYLQEFKTKREYRDERVKFREIAAHMRGVIKGPNIAGAILSQITVVEGKKYPDKHSIRESRDVSNAAEVVALGFTPDTNIIDAKDKTRTLVEAGQRCIKIDKAKDGQKITVPMDGWEDRSASFLRVTPPTDVTDDQFDDMFDNSNDPAPVRDWVDTSERRYP